MPHPLTLDAVRGRLQTRSGRGTNGSVHGGPGSGRGGPGSTLAKSDTCLPQGAPSHRARSNERGGGRWERQARLPCADGRRWSVPVLGHCAATASGPAHARAAAPGGACRATTPGACHAATIATTGTRTTGPALAKREGEGGLEERRA